MDIVVDRCLSHIVINVPQTTNNSSFPLQTKMKNHQNTQNYNISHSFIITKLENHQTTQNFLKVFRVRLILKDTKPSWPWFLVRVGIIGKEKGCGIMDLSHPSNTSYYNHFFLKKTKQKKEHIFFRKCLRARLVTKIAEEKENLFSGPYWLSTFGN